jgi:alpha-mannosidase
MINEKIYKERIQHWIKRVGDLVYSQPSKLKAEYIYDSRSPIPYSEINNHNWKAIEVGDKWADVWGCGWFRFKGKVPTIMTSAFVGVWLDIQGEACLFIDGVPHQGLTNKIDWNLQAGKFFVPLFPKAKGNEEIDILIETGANGLFGEDKKEYKLERADIVVYDSQAYKLWLDIRSLFSLWEGLTDNTPRKKRILYGLNQACNLWNEGRDKDACLEITKKLLSLPANASSLTAWSIGHAHIDVAWLWPLRETRRKCSRTFSTALRFLEEYPEYIFGASQAQLYQFVKEDYPELYTEIKEAVKNDRWECQGATWVEMDTNIPSGESLIRQCIYGRRFFKEEFDKEIDFLWLPDCFGYTGSLPQILKKSGVDSFISQKLSWNDTNTFPHHTYRWQGIDGSEVLCHFLPTNDYNFSNLPKNFIESENRYAQADVSDDFLNLYGIGDGGGGPSKEHIELGLRQKDLSGVPKFKFAKAKDFIAKIQKIAKKDLPVWQGELYFELHRGTYTTQAWMKKYNRMLEQKMQFIEFLSVLTNRNTSQYLQAIWKDILLNQFHDIIPGSSIGWVYDDAHALSTKNLQKLELLQHNLTSGLLLSDDNNNNIIIFNSLSHKRTEVIEFPYEHACDIYANDQLIPSQYQDNKLYFEVTVAAMGYKILKLGDSKKENQALINTNPNLENEMIKLNFDDKGAITSIWDKTTNEELLAAPANALKLWEDLPNNWGAWDINHFYRETTPELPCLLERKVTVNNKFKQSIYQRLSIASSEIKQTISIFKNSRLIEIENEVDWNEKHKMLRVAASPAIYSRNATSEIQFGLIERPTHKNTSWDWAKFEVLAHTFIDISDNNHGFAVLNDCKYGHSVQDNSLEINLLRSPADVHKEADLGKHSFTYAYYPHTNNLQNSDVINKAHALNQKLVILESDLIPEHTEYSLFELDNPAIIIQTVKYAEEGDDIILRCYESIGANQKTKLKLTNTYEKAYACNMLEINEEELKLEDNTLNLKFSAFEIKSIKLSKNKE